MMAINAGFDAVASAQVILPPVAEEANEDAPETEEDSE